eukprot:GHVT01013923.1.p1 GENE.GHVT01013923.1~~GHVT01013923.1.p1  ORF type:complete len:130 (+),score=19.61 GHVT01013923.1:1496-1885(+)
MAWRRPKESKGYSGRPQEIKEERADDVPDGLQCPITGSLMTDPVCTVDGHSYDRVAIEDWLARGHVASPLTDESSTGLSRDDQSSRVRCPSASRRQRTSRRRRVLSQFPGEPLADQCANGVAARSQARA